MHTHAHTTHTHTHTHTPHLNIHHAHHTTSSCISLSLRRKGPQKTKAITPKKSYFSSDLADVTTESNPLPVFVVRCVEVVDKDGLDVEGIYRLSGKQDEVVELHCKFDQGVCACVRMCAGVCMWCGCGCVFSYVY